MQLSLHFSSRDEMKPALREERKIVGGEKKWEVELTLDPRSLKMISTSKIFPNCCEEKRERRECVKRPRFILCLLKKKQQKKSIFTVVSLVSKKLKMCSVLLKPASLKTSLINPMFFSSFLFFYISRSLDLPFVFSPLAAVSLFP